MSFNNQDQFLNDSPDYFFNPYDSDSYPEPEESNSSQSSLDTRANVESVIINNESPLHRRPQNHIETSVESAAIVMSSSIQQSRGYIQQVLNNPNSQLHQLHTPGLVILPIQDFNLIRNDTRNNRVIRHLIIFPHLDPNFNRDHIDFSNSIVNLYS